MNTLMTTIGRAFKLKSGDQLSAKNMQKGSYPVFGGNGISEYHNEYTFEEPKVVIGRVGAYCGNVHLTDSKSWITDNALYIDEQYNEYDNKYLILLLRSLNLNQYASQSGQPLISYGRIKNVSIPLPPLPQQKKIAAILDAADTLRQKDKALIAKYDELAQSLFLQMFGDPVTNPKGWERIKLSDLTKITSGSTPSRDNEDNFIGTIPWVKTDEVKGDIILKSEEYISVEALANSSCKLYPAGSLVIAMYGQGITRGKVGVLGIEATTNQACAVIPPSDKMNYTFLLKLLEESYEDLRNLGRGGNQPNLNTGIIKAYPVINPTIELQNQFAERVQAIEQQKEQAQQSLQKSEELFSSLLQRAFKGELTI